MGLIATDVERLEWYIDRLDTPCWLWRGRLFRDGYGVFVMWGHRKLKAHKVMWERVNGPVPDGLELDHLCRNRECVNPDHLEAVTHAENMRRSPWHLATNTHCAHGHEMTDQNLLIRKCGKRVCRQCDQIRRTRPCSVCGVVYRDGERPLSRDGVVAHPLCRSEAPQAPGEGAGPSTVHPDWDAAWDRTWTR